MEPKESLRDILGMLRNTSNPQVEYFVRIIKKCALKMASRCSKTLDNHNIYC